MPTDDVFSQRAARAAQLHADLIEYEKALETVRAFEEKYPEFAADRRRPEPSPEESAESTQVEKPSMSPRSEELKGPNMQETVYNAALRIPPGTEFEPGRIVEILEAEAPMALAVYEIDEKKARDALGRLARVPGRGIERTRSGTRGRHGDQPAFRRFSGPDADEVPAGVHERGESNGMTISEFAQLALEVAGPPPRDTQDLITLMASLGWSSEAKDPYSSVFGTLRRELGTTGSRLEKRDGKWCLKGWIDNPAREDAVDAHGPGKVQRPRKVKIV